MLKFGQFHWNLGWPDSNESGQILAKVTEFQLKLSDSGLLARILPEPLESGRSGQIHLNPATLAKSIWSDGRNTTNLVAGIWAY
jgi:hypothetical protein